MVNGPGYAFWVDEKDTMGFTHGRYLKIEDIVLEHFNQVGCHAWAKVSLLQK